jgi:paraquat-inducible protein B
MFTGDVNGLKIGAPVKFKGVQIGSVEEIKLLLAPHEGEISPQVKELHLPVVIGIDQKLIQQRGGSGNAVTKSGFENMITRGLRAQLNVESLLTGLLFVDLDLHPDTPLSLVLVPGKGDLREIPTVPTSMEAIQRKATDALAKLDQIDFKALVSSITEAAGSIKDLTSSPQLKSTLEAVKQTTTTLNRTLVSMQATLDKAASKVDPMVASLQANSTQANATMKDTQEAVVELRSMLEPDSPISVNLNQALDQLANTSRSVGQLTDYLQRNPAALIRGKYLPVKEK